MEPLNEEKVKELLDLYQIPYLEKGKNIGEKFYGMSCPFCDDDSNHLGIHRKRGYFTCWKCKANGELYDLLHEVMGISWEEYTQVVGTKAVSGLPALDRIRGITNKEQDQQEEGEITKPVTMPKFCYPIIQTTSLPLLDNFLSKRDFTLTECEYYLCHYCRAGKWMNRMIIPITYMYELVSFTGADMTGTARVKHKHLSSGINQYLYNFDSLKNDRIIITEGIFDCWRVQEDAISTFGIHITKAQRRLILNYAPKELVLAWDADAYFKARKEAKKFQPFIDIIKVVHFPTEHDPDSYGKDHGKDKLMDLIESTERL